MNRRASPKVTVMMPALNVAKYIRASIESVLRQNYQDFELIILDDHSSDNTYQIAREYLKDPRVRLFRNVKHLGDAANRNKILHLARGKYIAPHDGDDTMLQGRLGRQVEFLEKHPKIGVVFGNVIVAYEKAERDFSLITGISQQGNVLQKSQRITRIPHNFSHCGSMVKKELILKAGSYDDSFCAGTDSRLYRRLFRITAFYFLNHFCFIYRRRSGSHFAKYNEKRSRGMRRYLHASGVRKGTFVVDKYQWQLERWPAWLRQSIAWRMNYYLEPAGRKHVLRRTERVSVAKVEGDWKKQRDWTRFRQGFLVPLSEELRQENRILLEAALVSNDKKGILIFSEKTENGDIVLPFLGEDYYYYSSHHPIIYSRGGCAYGESMIDPLIFSEPPRIARGKLDPRLFWNPLIRRYCMNADIFRTYILGETCKIALLVFIKTNSCGSRIEKRRMGREECYRMLRERCIGAGGSFRLFRQLAKQSAGWQIRCTLEKLKELPVRLRQSGVL